MKRSVSIIFLLVTSSYGTTFAQSENDPGQKLVSSKEEKTTDASDERTELCYKIQFITKAMQSHRIKFPTDSKLSWRVHLLPYLGEIDLFEAFALDEAWDSKHNRKLLKHIPEIFRAPGDSATNTRFKIFKSATLKSLTVAVVSTDCSVEWTKPEYDNDNRTRVGDKPFLAITRAGELFSIPNGYGDREIVSSLKLSPISTLRYKLTIPALEKKIKPSVPDAAQKLTAISSAWEKYDRKRRYDRNPQKFHPTLSWRVRILPFLGEEELYKQFKLNQPWDSEHNQKLYLKMPEAFRSADDEPDETCTRFVSLTGPLAFMSPSQRENRKSGFMFKHTIRFVHAPPDKRLPWTQVVDLNFSATRPFACIGGEMPKDGLIVYVGSNAVRLYPDIPRQLFASMCTSTVEEPIHELELHYYTRPLR